MKISIFALLTTALSVFSVDAHAAVVSHMRCGVLAGYEINVPFEYNSVTTEMVQPNPRDICRSTLNSLSFSIGATNYQPVSAGNSPKSDQKTFTVTVEPDHRKTQPTAADVIKTLYDKSTYLGHGQGGYPAQSPEKNGGMTYIKGTPLAEDDFRNDFYLIANKAGRLDYLIQCIVAGDRKNGRCEIGFKLKGLDLSVRVGISAEDVDSYKVISDKAVVLVQSMIKDRVSA